MSTSRSKPVFTAVYLAQASVAAGVESLLAKVSPSVPRDLLLESTEK